MIRLESSGSDCTMEAGFRKNSIYSTCTRPYKGLTETFRSWPDDVELAVFGSVYDQPEQYLESLKKILPKQSYPLERRVLEEKDVNSICINHNVMILPHAATGPIVTGTFFLAMTYGCITIAHLSKFIESEIPFYPEGSIQCYTREDELKNIIEKIKSNQDICALRNQIQKIAFERYCYQNIINLYKEIFN